MAIDANENWQVGDRILTKGSMPWMDESGERCFDTYEVVGRVTKVEHNIVYWEQEKVLKVHKSNPYVTMNALVPDSGGFNRTMHIEWITRIRPDPAPGPQWVREFGKEYDVPVPIRKAVADGLLDDCSWHNDTCPSFATQPDGEFVLWVAHPDVNMREVHGENRFAVMLNSYAEINYNRCDEVKYYYTGNDADEALKVILKLREGEKA